MVIDAKLSLTCQWCNSPKGRIAGTEILVCRHCDHVSHFTEVHDSRHCAACFEMFYSRNDKLPDIMKFIRGS